MAIKNTTMGSPVAPGEMLRDALEMAGLSANAAATKMKIPANRLSAILNGQRGITAETALRLGQLFGTSAQMWLNAQIGHELWLANRQHGAQIAREVQPLAKIA